jgi:hypothetical protein
VTDPSHAEPARTFGSVAADYDRLRAALLAFVLLS